MAMSNQLQFIKDNLYHLKNDYGNVADLYHVTTTLVNLQTGKKTITKLKYRIKKAIILPATYAAIFIKGSPTTPSTTQAPLVDLTKRLILVDKRDIPTGLIDFSNDYLVIDHQRYDIKGTTVLEDNISIIFITQMVAGAPPNEIYDLNVEQILRFNQSIT